MSRHILPKFKPVTLIWLAAPPLVWWALKDIPMAEVWAAVARLSGWQVGALVALNLLTLFSFSGMWWLILRSLGYRLPYLTLVGYRAASFGVSYFTLGPQFGGEPLQVYLLVRNHAVPGPAAAAATALDKMLELSVNIVLLAIGILLVGQWSLLPSLTGQGAMLGVLLLLVLLAAFLSLVYSGRLPLTRLMQSIPVRSERYRRAAAAVEESEQHMARFCREHPATLAAALGVAVATWGLMMVEYWTGMYFLGLPFTARQLIVAMTINRLAFLAPLPGGLGALEGSQVLAMSVLGLNPALGISHGLIIRARDVVVGLAGIGIGWRSGRDRSS
jgi:uncharacterized protein (TIRG00374 family)